MKDENVMNFRHSYSYSYSSSLTMTPASSSTVAVFHRRVGRYHLPMTRYLARRAVRRLHHPPSLGGMRLFPSVPLAVPAELDTAVQSSSRRRDPPSSFPALAGKNCNELN